MNDSLETLADRAVSARPRLFAMYGILGEEWPILGWGMDFRARGDALFYLPGGAVTHTMSAERVAQRYAHLGDMRISWLE